MDDTIARVSVVCVCAQVVLQHGGAVLEEYDPAHCTHVLALHKKSQLFEQVSSGIAVTQTPALL